MFRGRCCAATLHVARLPNVNPKATPSRQNHGDRVCWTRERRRPERLERPEGLCVVIHAANSGSVVGARWLGTGSSAQYGGTGPQSSEDAGLHFMFSDYQT